MEHTLNPRGITVNGKSSLITALLREIQKGEDDPKTMGAPPRGDAPLKPREVIGAILKVECGADLQDPRKEDRAWTQIVRAGLQILSRDGAFVQRIVEVRTQLHPGCRSVWGHAT